jgi:hypothetical protein
MAGTRKADIIRDIAAKIKQSEDNREVILSMLALKDVKIDEVDVLISNIDKEIPGLINNINVNVPPIKTAYDARITDGCRSDLKWEITETGTDMNDDAYTIYTCVKNDTRQQTNFYGQKYYRKPLNRDYGSNIIAEVIGNIDQSPGSGISTIAVTSADGIEGIRVGDLVTDNLDSPTIFSAGNLPRVTGIGSAPVLGITTTIQGNIGVGSDFFVAVGAGATAAVTVGSAVSMFNILPEGTTVIAIGTANAILPFYDEDAQSYANAVITRPAFQLSNPASSAATLQIMHVGSTDTKPTLILDAEALKTIDEQSFVIIRDQEGIDEDFDYQKSPLDPVTIGILGNQLGIGHKSEIVNNGFPPGPTQWGEVMGEDEPPIGADHVFYYTGTLSWPVATVGGFATYAVEGQTLVSTSSTLAGPQSTATVTSISPGPQSDCPGRDALITANEAALVTAVDNNITEINRLNDLSQVLREYRDEEELEAWGLLQSAAYEYQKAEKSKVRSSNFDEQDLTAFDP